MSAPLSKNKFPWKILGLLFGLAVLLGMPFLFWGDYFESVFSEKGAVEWLRAQQNFAWLAAVGLLISDLLLPVPATAVIGALGVVYGWWWGGIIGSCGSFLSGALAYLLCRLFGRRAARLIAGEEELRQSEDFFARSGGWAVAFSKWLPILPEALACLAGVSKMPPGRFFAALACGSIPLGFTFAAVGHFGANRPALSMLACALIPLALWLPLKRFFK